MDAEVFGKETFLMAFFLKTRWNLANTPESLSYGNHVDTPVELSTSSPQAGESVEEHEDYLRFRSQFPGSRTHFTVDTPRRWSLNLETGESGPSSFEPYVRPSRNLVPADSSNSQGPVESSSNQVPVESSDNQGPSAEQSTSSTERSPSILVDDDCEIVPSLQSHLGAVASRMSYFMRACRSCEQSLQDKINDLPKSKITAEHVDNAELCSVCMENFNLEEEVKQLPCSHLFHGDCITPWLKKRQTCPICRKVAVSVGGRARVKLHRFQPYHRRRQSNHMLFEPPQWRF